MKRLLGYTIVYLGICLITRLFTGVPIHDVFLTTSAYFIGAVTIYLDKTL